MWGLLSDFGLVVGDQDSGLMPMLGFGYILGLGGSFKAWVDCFKHTILALRFLRLRETPSITESLPT